VVPWNNNFAVEERLVWVRCRGLPFRFWSRQCFGTLVEVDDATTTKEVSEYVRLCVRVSMGGETKMVKLLRVNGIQCRLAM